MTETDMRAKLNIIAGIEFLDTYVAGWAERIDPHLLDMTSYTNCILGQLFGDFREAVRILGISEASKFGFDASNRIRFSNLIGSWREVIGKRQTGR